MRIGIDLGGTKTEGVLMDNAGSIIERLRTATPVENGYDAILDNIIALAVRLESLAGESCRVGIGTPGSISYSSGLLRNSNTVSLNQQPVKRDLEKRLGRPVRMANDANCFALSEAVDGAGAGYSCVFGVIIGTGVGGGIVFDRTLHQGRQHIAGEWGHNVLDNRGPKCYCGRRGCVETFLSGPGLMLAYKNAGGHSATDVPGIIQEAGSGDGAAIETCEQYLDRFGQALAMVINILDPDAIILGGGLSNIGQLYTEGVKRVARHTFNDELLTKILPNKHGDSSGVRGAAWLWQAGE